MRGGPGHGAGAADVLSVQDHGSYHHGFRPGEVVLVAQRRPGQLAVWRQGRPDDVVTVPVQDDYSTLRVRPQYWAIDMPVQLTGEWAAGWSGGVSAAPRSSEETVLLRETNSSTSVRAVDTQRLSVLSLSRGVIGSCDVT